MMSLLDFLGEIHALPDETGGDAVVELYRHHSKELHPSDLPFATLEALAVRDQGAAGKFFDEALAVARTNTAATLPLCESAAFHLADESTLTRILDSLPASGPATGLLSA
jgi:hypothetical protein